SVFLLYLHEYFSSRCSSDLDENTASEERLKMFHPVHTFVSKFITNFDAVNMHQKVIEAGEVIYKSPPLEEIQKYAVGTLDLLWDEYKRSLNPEEYPVDLSEKCWNNKMRNIQEVRESVQEFTNK